MHFAVVAFPPMCLRLESGPSVETKVFMKGGPSSGGHLLGEGLHAKGIDGMGVQGVQHVLQHGHLDLAARRRQEGRPWPKGDTNPPPSQPKGGTRSRPGALEPKLAKAGHVQDLHPPSGLEAVGPLPHSCGGRKAGDLTEGRLEPQSSERHFAGHTQVIFLHIGKTVRETLCFKKTFRKPGFNSSLKKWEKVLLSKRSPVANADGTGNFWSQLVRERE